MITYTKESLIEALRAIRERGWIATKRINNDGGVGNTLEDLLGIDENNLPLPNAAEWELKAQKIGTSALVTLFHMEPSPRAYKFVPSILLPEFGWRHRQAGRKYGDSEKSFRQTISTAGFSNRGFTVRVNEVDRKVLIEFNSQEVDDSVHPEWANFVSRKRLEPQPYWGFDDLFHKAGTKLHNCFYVKAESKKIDGVVHFHYEDIYMMKSLSIDRFIRAIADGNVYLDFDARTGHNHGTKFRLKSQALVALYEDVREL